MRPPTNWATCFWVTKHTPQALMKADWETDDFRAMAQNRFRFSPEETLELNRRKVPAVRPGSVRSQRRLPDFVP
jgi:hypothetical protein